MSVWNDAFKSKHFLAGLEAPAGLTDKTGLAKWMRTASGAVGRLKSAIEKLILIRELGVKTLYKIPRLSATLRGPPPL